MSHELWVAADAARVSQIVSNLLGNALKFTEKGSITISYTEQDGMVSVFVKDTGIGILAKNQAKLFGKFQQVFQGTEDRPSGTGLGLYISKAMAQKMGGDLWLEKSEVGRGSTFGFSLKKQSKNS